MSRNSITNWLTAAGVTVSCVAIVLSALDSAKNRDHSFRTEVFLAFLEMDREKQQQFYDNIEDQSDTYDETLKKMLTDSRWVNTAPSAELNLMDDQNLNNITSIVSNLASEFTQDRRQARTDLATALSKCDSLACVEYLVQVLDGGNLKKSGSYRTSLGVLIALGKQEIDHLGSVYLDNEKLTDAVNLLALSEDTTMRSNAEALQKLFRISTSE